MVKKTPTVVTYNVADLKGAKKDMGGGMHDTWNGGASRPQPAE